MRIKRFDAAGIRRMPDVTPLFIRIDNAGPPRKTARAGLIDKQTSDDMH